MTKADAVTAARQARSFEKLCVSPMAEAGCLGCGLLQLSPHFRKEGDNLTLLNSVLDALSYDHFPYAVEFRHRSWLDEGDREIAGEVIDALRDRNVANALIDGPGPPITGVQTSDHAYARFHGRNRDIWYREEDDQRINRYDYLYSNEQLENWVPIIDQIGEKTKNIRLYFNNHGRAKAAKNAFQMMDLLSIPHEEREVGLQDQMKLRSYE
jgi:uncharacterized protein YecE (DUF72 family)